MLNRRVDGDKKRIAKVRIGGGGGGWEEQVMYAVKKKRVPQVARMDPSGRNRPKRGKKEGG